MDVYLGIIQLFAFNYPPIGWALCNGQMLSVNENQALFTLIGTHFGGDGVTNFAVPNLNQAALSTNLFGNWYIATQGIYPNRN